VIFAERGALGFCKVVEDPLAGLEIGSARSSDSAAAS